MSFNGKSQSDLLNLFWNGPISESRNLINHISFKANPEKIDRKGLSPNPAAVHLLKPNPEKIDWDMVTHHLISRTHINPEDETDSDMPELVPATETDETDSDMPELVPVTETDETDSDMPELVPVTETDDTGEDTNLRFIGEERRHTGMYCYFHEACAVETWYIYEDKNGNVTESKTQLH